MKLLYVHDRIGALGGAEANVFITAGEMKKRGHEVALLHGSLPAKNPDNWRKLFESCIQTDTRDSIRTAIQTFNPDVIYVHKMSDVMVLEELTASGRPLLHMVHDHDIYCMRSYKYNYFTRNICRRSAGPWCVFPCGGNIAKSETGFPIKWNSFASKRREIELNKRFDRMLVVTTYMRDELIQNGFDPARIEIHPPVPRAGDASIRSTFGDRNLIIYAGQIIRGKGVDILLEALAKVRSPFECIILGDGGQRGQCEKLRDRLGLQGKVHFKGFIPQEELKSYYKEATLVAISSVWPEPIATIGLEVMRYALPVVAFDAGGIKDWLIDGHNGYLVPWMDRDQYASRIDELLRDKKLARDMGENGFKLVSEQYDFDRYLDGLENLFRTVSASKTITGIPSAHPLPVLDSLAPCSPAG